MEITKIALGDLRHKTVGSGNNPVMPLNIGFIATSTFARLGEKTLEIRLYTDAEKLLADIDTWKPSVLGLTNYCWSSELSRRAFEYAKKVDPATVCVSGGPHFPIVDSECHEYLLRRKDIDFNVCMEGEEAFARLMDTLRDTSNSLDFLKSQPHPNIMTIHPRKRSLVRGEILPRIMDMDIIPSPYLSGIMDQFFDGNYAPMIETARGCPYQCAFCFVGLDEYKDLAKFSLDRVKADLNYIAERMHRFQSSLLTICDSNFGMYQRDEEIASHIRTLQDKYDWPMAFNVTTGKAQHERIIRVAETLQNKMHISGSVQTLNRETSKLIKRRNLPIPKYTALLSEIKKRKMHSGVELIIPMPGESKETFLNGMETIVDAGAGTVIPYTTMLLPGTEIASKEFREKYKMKSKFRILPRQFGDLRGSKCFEIEEVCVSTNTMSYEDYLDCRGLSFVAGLFASDQYDLILQHLKELEIKPFDYYLHLWELIKVDKTGIGLVYKLFIQETEDELWDSPEEIYEHFSKPKNYEALLKSILGDNLMRKYKTEVFLEHGPASFEFVYNAFETFDHKKIHPDYFEAMKAAKRWAIMTRAFAGLHSFQDKKECDQALECSFDINSWYFCEDIDKSLMNFRGPASYKVVANVSKVQSILEEGKRFYGEDLKYCLAKQLIYYGVKAFWRSICRQKNVDNELLLVRDT